MTRVSMKSLSMALMVVVAMALLVQANIVSDVLSAVSGSTGAGSTCQDGADGTCTEGTLGNKAAHWGNGGELQQDGKAPLTSNFGTVLADDENSLKANERGPILLEDWQLREKITHFDHERIPERVVHARGNGAHGKFEVTNAAYISQFTKAKFLQKDGDACDVFVRFSTVTGPRGSVDTPRDVRGFATRFYTSEGNWDLVGNNIPVFFIQDSSKFPDLIHAAKQEPDRGFPSAATAHDNFWDFISLMPESMHMIQWAMSDRTLPRSLRTMEGFGVHTFRLVQENGNSSFVKFHWKPRLGLQSTIWDETLKLQAADNDFHRRDLWEAIANGAYPQWDLGVQVFSENDTVNWNFDYLDSTKLVPEELVPVVLVGVMTLNRNPDNYFQETEQVAYHPGNVVPGIDFSNDPLLHGRLHSYIDTQLLRLGGPNYHQIPINQPRCPYFNLQQDGFHRTTNRKGRTNYSPNTRPDADAPTYGTKRQSFAGLSRPENGITQRTRPHTFSDHYTQARLFFLSQSVPEQNHIAAAFTFELSKVEEEAIRIRIVSHLQHVDQQLAARVATALGLNIGTIAPAPTTVLPKDVTQLSPSLSIVKSQGNNTLEGRTAGILITDGADGSLLEALRSALIAANVNVKIIAPHMGMVQLANTTDSNSTAKADVYVAASNPAQFDFTAIIASAAGAKKLLTETAAINFLGDSWSHLKAIGYSAAAVPLLQKAGIDLSSGDAGLVALSGGSAKSAAPSVAAYLAAAANLKFWDREPSVRTIV